MELKAHQALDIFGDYDDSFVNQQKAKEDLVKKLAKEKAEAEEAELKSKKVEAEIVKKELALSFPNEAYLSDKKAAKDITDKINTSYPFIMPV